jgi:hypothetical protein
VKYRGPFRITRAAWSSPFNLSAFSAAHVASGQSFCPSVLYTAAVADIPCRVATRTSQYRTLRRFVLSFISPGAAVDCPDAARAREKRLIPAKDPTLKIIPVICLASIADKIPTPKGPSSYSVAQENRAGSMEPNHAFASIADWIQALRPFKERPASLPQYGKIVALGGTYVLHAMWQ